MKMMSKILRYFGYILFRPIWWLERLVPRSKKIWVFGAWYGQKYSDNSKWFYEYVLEHNPEIKAVWITKNRDVYNKLRSQNKPVCMSASAKGVWWCLRAKYALLTSGVVDVNAYTLNGCRQIWLWHGMPLKKIGYSMFNNNSKIRLVLGKILNPYYHISPFATLSSSEYFNKFLQEAFHLQQSQIWNTGLPRCDSFFLHKKDEFIEKLRSEYNNAKIIIYMPTFRMSSDIDGNPFNPFTNKFNFEETQFINFLNSNNIIFLYKPHFVDKSINVSFNSSRFILINDDNFNDLYILLDNVDYLMTDYSSVYFDFLPTQKPIFLLPFDYEEYTKNSRAHYFNMYKELDCPFVAKDWNDFYKNFHSCLTTKYCNNDVIKFANFVNGKSCQSVITKILEN